MDNIFFVNALEGEFEFDRTVDFKTAMQQKAIGVAVGATLLLSETKDIVGMLFSVNMKYKEEVVLSYSVILTFQVKGWSDEVNDSDKDAIKMLPEVGELLAIAVGFLRGSMYVHTKNSPLEGLTIPVLSIPELQKNLKVEQPKQNKC